MRPFYETIFGASLMALQETMPGLSPALLLAAAFLLLLVVVMAVRLSHASRQAKVITGTAGMIGLKGKAETAIAPKGMVFVRGELWHARSHTHIAQGDQVRVVGLDGLTLVVEAEKEGLIAPRSVSALDED